MNKSLLIFTAVALSISGCSTVGLLYGNADWYLQHKIGSYVSFNAGQEATIRREISVYLNWHRKHALPEYIIFLQNLNGAAQYEGQLKRGRIAQLRAQLLELYHLTLQPAVRPAAEILSSLDNRQIRELSDNLAKENSKQMHELSDIGHDAYLDKRADSTLDFLEGLVGDLSREQRKQIRDMSRQLPEFPEIYLEHRYANQRRLIRMLDEHAGADRIAAFLSLWLLDPDATRTSRQQLAIHSFETASDEMVARIQWTLTARQKAHLNKQLSRYIDELRKLSAATKAARGGSGIHPAAQSQPGANR
ncbi:MAG: DUF6279 family lipoprotein [Gallionella sp.]